MYTVKETAVSLLEVIVQLLGTVALFLHTVSIR